MIWRRHGTRGNASPELVKRHSIQRDLPARELAVARMIDTVQWCAAEGELVVVVGTGVARDRRRDRLDWRHDCERRRGDGLLAHDTSDKC
jgi:hypothetical protein